MADGFDPKDLWDSFQKLWNPLSYPMPPMFQPAMTVEEVDKRIAELQAVENWLKVNLSLVQMTTKTFEMQRSALQTMHDSTHPRDHDAD